MLLRATVCFIVLPFCAHAQQNTSAVGTPGATSCVSLQVNRSHNSKAITATKNLLLVAITNRCRFPVLLPISRNRVRYELIPGSGEARITSDTFSPTLPILSQNLSSPDEHLKSPATATSSQDSVKSELQLKSLSPGEKSSLRISIDSNSEEDCFLRVHWFVRNARHFEMHESQIVLSGNAVSTNSR
jgi:hypothetical protein